MPSPPSSSVGWWSSHSIPAVAGLLLGTVATCCRKIIELSADENRRLVSVGKIKRYLERP